MTEKAIFCKTLDCLMLRYKLKAFAKVLIISKFQKQIPDSGCKLHIKKRYVKKIKADSLIPLDLVNLSKKIMN